MRFQDAPLVARAVADAEAKNLRHERLWQMTSAERLASYQRGEMTLGDCLAWARRYPDEPPVAPSGEYLFIEVRTPEWDDEPVRRPLHRAAGREV